MMWQILSPRNNDWKHHDKYKTEYVKAVVAKDSWSVIPAHVLTKTTLVSYTSHEMCNGSNRVLSQLSLSIANFENYCCDVCLSRFVFVLYFMYIINKLDI